MLIWIAIFALGVENLIRREGRNDHGVQVDETCHGAHRAAWVSWSESKLVVVWYAPPDDLLP